MKKINNFLTKEYFKNKIYPEVFRVFIVIISTLIYGVGLSWFIQVSEIRMYGGGIPGVAQLLVDVFKVTNILGEGGVTPAVEDTMMFIVIIVLNIPIILLGWFGVSKKFTAYSMISVVLQATIIGYIKIDIFEGVDPILLSIFGGLLIGMGIGIAMKYGTSTGGFDVISQYISLKKGKSVGSIITAINLTVMVLGAGLLGFGEPVMVGSKTYTGIEITGLVSLYTVLRLFISMIAIDKIHTTYNYVKYNIITEYAEELSQTIIEEIHRGVTILDARGGYAFNEKSMVYLIIMNFERPKLLEIIKRVDPNAFVVSTPVGSIDGNFSKKTIA